MKKALPIIIAAVVAIGIIVLCLVLFSGGSSNGKTTAQTNNETTPPETYYQIGDTVSTNLFNFTLDAATLAIALENTRGENFGDPKEYDPKDDNGNPYVAPTGHTYAAFTYTVENISRSSVEFHSGNFVNVIYKNTEYTTTLDECAELYYQDHQYYSNGSMHTKKANTWYSTPSRNMLVSAGEKQSRKTGADFAIETDSLADAFYLRVRIPSSTGIEVFTYQIPASN